MAGTPVGKVDCDISAIAATGNQELFKNSYDFFQQMVTAGYATRIALCYGSASGSSSPTGTGTNYHDEADPFEENAFFLFRINGSSSGNTESARDGVTLPDFNYYVFMQWADTRAFGGISGDFCYPALLDGFSTGDGVGISVAVREDGASPWNGTTNNNGLDTKGDPVWTNGGTSVVHIMPISNSYTGGSHLTKRENTKRLDDIATGGLRMSWIGTADSMVLLADRGDDADYMCYYFGIYEPRLGLSPSLPLVSVLPYYMTEGPWVDGSGTVWGNIGGTTGNQGGVLGTLLADLCSPLHIGMDVTGILDAVSQPNNEISPSELDAFAIRVVQRSSGRVGYVGNLERGLIEVVYNVATNQTNADQTRAYFGSATQASFHWSVPWNGSTTPGTNLTRAGVTF